MYARVTTFHMDPSKLEEALDISRASILPVMKQQQGFKGVFTLVDRQAGKTLSITLWETEADVQAGASSGYLQGALAKLAPLVSAAPTVETYEVPLQE
jgi:heme-degrading monooxygenase HmoA